MSASEKTPVLARVASSTLPRRPVLKDLGVPKSTYYRWLTREQRCQGLENQPGSGLAPWNRLSQPEEQAVLTVARRAPELRCRQLAAWITDNQGSSVSESTVYRILRREGLVKSPEMQLKAGKEYHRKTTGPNQMWATDAAYFTVIGWAYYYHKRYHMALGNVTPADVLNGRREQILQRRKEVQVQTIERRRRYNRTLKELARHSS